MLPCCLISTLSALPAVLWMVVGVGLPWALALLPRKDWREPAIIGCVALAVGPGVVTAWMFVLGTLGHADNQLLDFQAIIGGSLILALVGVALAWRKRHDDAPAAPSVPLAFDEKLLIALIGIALVVRWLGTAYWPFTAYDALWVYGYEGRLYALAGHIPQHIGYYPQFLPLQFTYLQLAAGDIDDHAARAVLPFLHVGSILAAYVLGARLINRRTGIFAAAIWALYPHVGEWSRFGDLEIPLAFLFTASAAFFLMAWTGQQPRRQYALIAGVLFGIALWTKPTAGAFVWGVLLLLVIELVRVRFDLRAFLPRFEVAVITGLASAPLGLAWYVRNVLLGHNPVDFPSGFWQTLAQQSGVEFGWLLLALLVLLAYLYFGRRGARPDVLRGVVGLALVLAGLLPSILSPHRITLVEWLALAAGAALLAWTLIGYARTRNSASLRYVSRVPWGLALALPYFVTWFFSYSYHYRLSFAIVPLMILPTAAVLARWIPPEYAATGRRKTIVTLAALALSLNGLLIPLYDVNAGWDWLFTDKLPDDTERYRSGNAALMNVVEGLEAYLAEQNAPLVVVAPGVDRLPFFFPLEDIRVEDVPTWLDDMRGVTYFVYGLPEGMGAYGGVPPLQNQMLGALQRDDIVRRAWGLDDGIFRYDVYELNLDNRYVKPRVLGRPQEGDVVFGGFARFLGHDLGGDTFWAGREVVMHLYWEVVAPPPDDYMIFVHLRDRNGNLIATWDGPVAPSPDGVHYYSTLLWEPKEVIVDERVLSLDEVAADARRLRLFVGLYNVATGERVPFTINGKPVEADSYRLDEDIRLVIEPPS